MGTGSPRASGTRAAYATAAPTHTSQTGARPEREQRSSVDETSVNVVRLARALVVCLAAWIVLGAVAYAIYALVA